MAVAGEEVVALVLKVPDGRPKGIIPREGSSGLGVLVPLIADVRC